MLRQNRMNKKALSEVIAYTLLIVISIGLAAGVYSFLKVYLPKETAACDSDISIIIDDYNCTYAPSSLSSINITFLNKGLFKVEGVLVRLGAETSKARKQITSSISYINIGPSEVANKVYGSISDEILANGAAKYMLEIQPVQIINGKPVACSNAIISQPIECR